MVLSEGGKTWDTFWEHGGNLVFEVNLGAMTGYPNGDRLPNIWVTEPILDDEGGYGGQSYVMLYPCADTHFPGQEHDDEDGEDALYFGGCYYDEGMSYTDPADREKRIDCFRATEVFYRYSAGRGNAVANLCLGYVYSYDRCEGNYWRDPIGSEAGEDRERLDPCEQRALGGWSSVNSTSAHPYLREQRAFECFRAAAEAGIPEACYKLGDLYKHGMGCEPDAAEAFFWYERASELAARERPVILGSIALRLADCYEEGFGCGQDFARALSWYEKAAAGLGFAVDNGEAWYEKALASARAGMKRCLQEL